ncbi:MAG: ABC transporter permease [Kiritimatiellia bacterium]
MSLPAFIRGPAALLHSFFLSRNLWFALTRREVAARYRGSLLGILWSFITPLILIATYTLVFVFFFKNQWSKDHTQPGYFIIMLFCGLIPFNFFSEVISRSPSLILSFPNYVKRISFPVHLLPAVIVGSSLFHMLMALLILIPGIYAVNGSIPPTILYLPLVWIPFVLFTLAMSLLLSGMGVFLRDLNHAVGLVLNMLFFLSPIFYPAALVPEKWRIMLWLNPVACAVLQMRDVCVQGRPLNLEMWGWQIFGSFLFLFLVAGWFRMVNRRFADVM